MAKLDKGSIKTLSELSHIGCTEDEQEAILKDLAGILDYVELLNELDTEKVAPCNQVLADSVTVMREDRVGEPMPRDLFLANAPESVGGLVRVPTVIKQKK